MVRYLFSVYEFYKNDFRIPQDGRNLPGVILSSYFINYIIGEICDIVSVTV